MRSRTRTVAVLFAAAVAVAFVAAGCGGGGGSGGNSTTTNAASNFKAALVSDVAGFNDNGFNKNQLLGLNKMKSQLGIQALPIVSHSSSDYVPNYNKAVHANANIIIAAGFLLGDTVKKYAKQYPKIDFAITDDPVSAIGGYKNEIGITYATQEVGCLVGVLAAKEAQIFISELLSAAPHIPVQVAHLAGSGGYDDHATDSALSIFLHAIAHHDQRISHLYFDISAVAGLGDWKNKKQLIASRIREAGVHRILFGSDGAWTSFIPLRAEADFQALPLTREEFRVIDTNVPPYMRESM